MDGQRQPSLDPGGWILFFILFFWQHPHFYSIAFIHKEDYARAGLKMLPVLKGGKRDYIFFHALNLIPISLTIFFKFKDDFIFLDLFS
ncbi:MAG: hypothetical protein Ct9H300mP18_03930 [Candidatus Neomarinimicrobiota bacterium]|nr:MAG: hypothetical protein Ct9H300mP18_03930 [Candidatus Neomarinimicrobiota bacterium]